MSRPNVLEAKVLEALRERPMSINEIVAATGLERKRITNAVWRLGNRRAIHVDSTRRECVNGAESRVWAIGAPAPITSITSITPAKHRSMLAPSDGLALRQTVAPAGTWERRPAALLRPAEPFDGLGQ